MATITNDWLDVSFASDSGTGDGSTTDFIVTYDLKSAFTIWVTLDGLLLTITTHYTVTVGTKTISFVTAPAAGQKITIKYMRL
jgi:hypothetical protein